MADYLHKYKVILEVKSPVFIGNGRNINKKEYIFDYYGKKVLVPDFEKMFQFMLRTGRADKYQEYLLNDRRDFARWLQEQKIGSKEYMGWIDYILDSGDSVFEDRSKKEIFTFVKDAYGHPYIPGSALKGAFRTALLAWDIQQNKERYSRAQQDVMGVPLGYDRKKMLQKEVRSLEQTAFYKIKRVDEKGNMIQRNAVNDIMSGIRVSDSKALDKNSLVLCQKVDENVDGTERKMPMLRECLKPGTVVEFELTIDSSLIDMSVSELLKAIDFLAQYNAKVFDASFGYPDRVAEHILVLGGGAGYQSKTISYILLGSGTRAVKRVSQVIDATLPKSIRDQHRHYKDQQLGISPHTIKKTYYSRRKYGMGICKISIE